MNEIIRDYIKAFIAGMTFPYIFFAIVASVLGFTNNIWVLQSAPLYLVGLCWGTWNLLYFIVIKRFIDHIATPKIVFGLHGAILGVLIYLMMVVVFQVPGVLGFPSGVIYPLVIAVPIIYFCVWYFLVAWLNEFFGFEI